MNTAGLVGTWSISLPGAVSITDSRQRVDAQTVEKTSKVTITTGQAGMGSRTIRADGTYRLVWDSKTTTGRWDRSPDYPFAGTIRLLDAHPHKHWDDRNWYVFVKDDGEKEAHFPPHTGYDAVRLRPASRRTASVARLRRRRRSWSARIGPSSAFVTGRADDRRRNSFTG